MAPQMSETLKGQMVGMWRSGESFRYIARHLNVDIRTVSRWINRYKKTNSLCRSPGSGRPQSLSDSQAREVVACAVVEPFISAKQIQNELHLQVTPQTLRNTLLSAGLRCRRAAKKPSLTENQRLQRLQFAQAHLNWDFHDWKSVLFTDESCIQSDSNASVHVYRPKDCRFVKEYTKKRRQSGRLSLSVWGCMSSEGIGTLCRIQGHLDGSAYCDILEHHMIPDALNNHFKDGFFLFQQDNSSIHRSGIVEKWFESHEIRRIEWPSNAADMNPIENVWALWKRNVNLRNVKTTDDLWKAALDSWEEIKSNPQLSNNLIESMPLRMKEVVDRQGQYTSY